LRENCTSGSVGRAEVAGCGPPPPPTRHLRTCRTRLRLGEVGEERGRAKGNTAGKTHSGHSAGQGASSALGRVREVARRDKGARFTALLHHVTVSRLRAAYWAMSPKAASGVDGVTWVDYGRNLEARLADLHQQVQSGRYRAAPSRRA
jgi:RNA-directed DNA polymerase